MPSFELLLVITLIVLACGDLVVGVVNDAVNFLQSAIGSRVAPKRVILMVAAVGVLVGTLFSDGIMEVARKGIFHPGFFSLEEVIMVFAAVILADILLLDLYSTFGLPTSTTVSVVFELLGAAYVLALWKTGDLTLSWGAINSASALRIVLGIILSIGIAFAAGLIIQFLSRLLFTFNFSPRLRRFGFLWCGAAFTAIVFFILLKGGKHSVFMTVNIKGWISTHVSQLIAFLFVCFSLFSWLLIRLRVRILSIIILLGTGSLAIAFAGNDLANFIGVSIAGVHAFLGAELEGALPTPPWVLLMAGGIMILAMAKSRKVKTVTNTEITLASHQKKVLHRWKPNLFVRKTVSLTLFFYKGFLCCIPQSIKSWIAKRWEPHHHRHINDHDYDLIRAGVNLMVASIVISIATSMKLPLSTTYVTFMVAMGTSLADGAWDSECAAHRLTGVLMVVGGWFMTALAAATSAGLIVTILYKGRETGLILMITAVFFLVYKLSKLHLKRELQQQEMLGEVMN